MQPSPKRLRLSLDRSFASKPVQDFECAIQLRQVCAGLQLRSDQTGENFGGMVRHIASGTLCCKRTSSAKNLWSASWMQANFDRAMCHLKQPETVLLTESIPSDAMGKVFEFLFTPEHHEKFSQSLSRLVEACKMRSLSRMFNEAADPLVKALQIKTFGRVGNTEIRRVMSMLGEMTHMPELPDVREFDAAPSEHDLFINHQKVLARFGDHCPVIGWMGDSSLKNCFSWFKSEAAGQSWNVQQILSAIAVNFSFQGDLKKAIVCYYSNLNTDNDTIFEDEAGPSVFPSESLRALMIRQTVNEDVRIAPFVSDTDIQEFIQGTTKLPISEVHIAVAIQQNVRNRKYVAGGFRKTRKWASDISRPQFWRYQDLQQPNIEALLDKQDVLLTRLEAHFGAKHVCVGYGMIPDEFSRLPDVIVPSPCTDCAFMFNMIM